MYFWAVSTSSEEAGAGQRSRGVHRLAAHLDADDADRDGAELLQQIGLQVVIRGPWRQWRADCRRDVGGQNGRPALTAAQEIEKAPQARVTLVELVVAEFESVEADRVHQSRIGLAVVEGVVERAGHRVTGVNLQQIGELGTGPEKGRQTGKTAGLDACRDAIEHQFEIPVGFEVGMVVVDMGDTDFQASYRGGWLQGGVWQAVRASARATPAGRTLEQEVLRMGAAPKKSLGSWRKVYSRLHSINAADALGSLPRKNILEFPERGQLLAKEFLSMKGGSAPGRHGRGGKLPW
jgi:hypothetical protein